MSSRNAFCTVVYSALGNEVDDGKYSWLELKHQGKWEVERLGQVDGNSGLKLSRLTPK